MQLRVRDPDRLDEAERLLERARDPLSARSSRRDGHARRDRFGSGGLFTLQLTEDGLEQRVRRHRRSVDRGHRPPHRRTRHDRAEHPAAGQRPHPRRGAGPRRSGAAQGDRRPDGAAHLPSRGHLDAGGAGGAGQAAAGFRGARFGRRSAAALSRRAPRDGDRRGPRRRAAGLRPADQRADRHLPASTAGAQQVRRRHAAECRAALRHRARRRGDLSAPVIREPILGGSGQISGSFTVQEANDLCDPAARRRAAGDADHRRGAHRRSEPRRGLDPGRHDRGNRRRHRCRRVHARLLRPPRRLRRHRADREHS